MHGGVLGCNRLSGITAKTLLRSEEDKKKVAVYNCASSSTKPITMGEMVDMGLSLLEKIPVGKVVWVPSAIITPSYFLYNFFFFFTHLIPALIADVGLKLAGEKFRFVDRHSERVQRHENDASVTVTPPAPTWSILALSARRLMKVQRKLYTANTALGYFTTRTWRFGNEKMLDMDTLIPLKDRPSFRFAIVDREPIDFFEKAAWGGRRYLMKTPEHTLESDRAHFHRWVRTARHHAGTPGEGRGGGARLTPSLPAQGAARDPVHQVLLLHCPGVLGADLQPGAGPTAGRLR